MKVPFLRPDIRLEDIRWMTRSVESGWLVPGPHADRFEKELARFLKVPYAVLVDSATAALHMSLVLAGVEEGDEVITTPLSWVATSNVILYQRAKVVFADVDPKTGILDPDEVEKKITKKTKAILLVHLYGQMADMKRFKKLRISMVLPSLKIPPMRLKRVAMVFVPGSTAFLRVSVFM